MPNVTLYLSKEAKASLDRVANKSRFASRAITEAFSVLAEARRTLTGLGRSDLMDCIEATNGLRILEGSSIVDTVSDAVKPMNLDLATDLRQRADAEDICRAIITIRDAYFESTDTLEWAMK